MWIRAARCRGDQDGWRERNGKKDFNVRRQSCSRVRNRAEKFGRAMTDPRMVEKKRQFQGSERGLLLARAWRKRSSSLNVGRKIEERKGFVSYRLSEINRQGRKKKKSWWLRIPVGEGGAGSFAGSEKSKGREVQSSPLTLRRASRIDSGKTVGKGKASPSKIKIPQGKGTEGPICRCRAVARNELNEGGLRSCKQRGLLEKAGTGGRI